ARAAVRFDRERPEVHRLLLDLSAKLADEAIAQDALRALCELDQHDALLHVAYLSLLAKNKDWAAALQAGETALFIAPENAAVHLHLGQAYVETGAYTRGLVELDRALTLGHAQPGIVRLARARAFLRQRNREAALREVKLALLSDPSLRQRGRALLAP
ncbi:MAG: tetratricopeptide repeat protein, partial [Polyangiales bacterium]